MLYDESFWSALALTHAVVKLKPYITECMHLG